MKSNELPSKVCWLLVALTLAWSGHAWSAAAPMNNDIAASLRQQTELCAEGETPGTVGHAINTAVDVHTRIAATPIDTDGLFNGNDCFDQLMDVIDLSSTVIDFSNIWASAQQALIQWAQRRVCTTVNDMANRVLEPVNNTIEAIKYRRAYARANNAIEGVVLSETDRRFMDSISVGMSKTDFTKAVLNHLRSKRH